MRKLKYCEAIAEGTVQAMERDPSIFVMGEGVDDATGIFGTTRTAFEKFGKQRVFDTPLSENALTGWGTGAALNGMKPLMVHARNDFLFLAMDQLVNHAAKWKYMHRESVPWTIRGIIGRHWGQAAQHSQALHSIFACFPGLKVLMPATPRDAKGLLISSLFDPSPVIILEHRRLYNVTGDVPSDYYETPLGKASIIKEGDDVTIVSISQMIEEVTKASKKLEDIGIHAEVLDLRSIRPLDMESIFKSVKKTGRLVVCDVGWKQFGLSGEIVAQVSEQSFSYLKASPQRIGLPDCPTPCSYALEEVYYPNEDHILKAIMRTFSNEYKKRFSSIICEETKEDFMVVQFDGPF